VCLKMGYQNPVGDHHFRHDFPIFFPWTLPSEGYTRSTSQPCSCIGPYLGTFPGRSSNLRPRTGGLSGDAREVEARSSRRRVEVW
jgi:hypothetical protein